MDSIKTKVDHTFHASDRKEYETSSVSIELRKKWEEYPKEYIVKRFPLHLDIESTSRCDLKCSMCPRTSMIEKGTFRKSKDFDFELYKRIVDEGAEKGLGSIKYNNLGEPLLNKRLVDMIKYAKEKGIPEVMFNTNALSLTVEVACELIEAGLDKLFFSFDSPYKDKYESIRAGANFEKVFNNIKRFCEIRKSLGLRRPFTRVSMVRMDNDEREWEDFKALFGNVVDSVAYVNYIDHHEGDDVVLVTEKDNKIYSCPQLWQRMFIDSDGSAGICCVDSARTVSMGNVYNSTVEEIWTGEGYQRLRELHKSGRFNEIPICSNCAFIRFEDGEV